MGRPSQHDGIPLVNDVTWAANCREAMPVIHRLLEKSLALAAAGDRGTPQEHSAATYAGFMEPEFSFIDWSKSAFEIHNQVRTHRYMRSRDTPTARVGNEHLHVIRTSLEPAEGLEVACGDGKSQWITECEPVRPTPPAATRPAIRPVPIEHGTDDHRSSEAAEAAARVG
jgi:methionyl-tRNA formyltransferase